MAWSSLFGFDGNHAYEYLESQTQMGPRNPGSNSHQQIQNWLIDLGKAYGDTVIVQDFQGRDPFNKTDVPLKNILVRYKPDATRRVMLSAHYDTRPVADQDPDPQKQKQPIPGANDGASGVAVLLETMTILKDHPLSVGVDIMFWDGEDLGRPNHPEEFCQGSRYYAYHPIGPVPFEGILLDMIGDAELTIYFESYSLQYHPDLMHYLFDMADDLGFGDIFIPQLQTAVYDDHVPLNLIADIPTVDLIDFHYPNTYENYWHTHEDSADKCSPASLEAVGTVIINYLENR